MGYHYSYQEIENLWVQYGGSRDTAAMAAAIAMAESRGYQEAYNGRDPNGGSFGLFQINGVHGDLASYDLETNVKAAIQISKDGKDWSAWSTSDPNKSPNNNYTQFLNESIQPDGKAVKEGEGTGTGKGSPKGPSFSAQSAQKILNACLTASNICGTAASEMEINLQIDDGLDLEPWYKDRSLMTGNPRARQSVQPISFVVYLDQQQFDKVQLRNPRTGEPIQLQLNCSLQQYTIESRHVVTRTPSKTGMHVTFWGMQPDLITGQGSTGVFMNQFGITDWFSLAKVSDDIKQAVLRGLKYSGPLTQEGRFSNIMSKTTRGLPNPDEAFRVAAQDAFVEFMKLFQMNGVVWYTSTAYNGFISSESQKDPNAWSETTGLSTFQMIARNNDVMARGWVAMQMKDRTYYGYFKSLSWTMDAEKPFAWNFNFVFQVEKTTINLFYPDAGVTQSPVPVESSTINGTILKVK